MKIAILAVSCSSFAGCLFAYAGSIRLRQLIHSSQLASRLSTLSSSSSHQSGFFTSPRIAVGGDTTLTYFAMIRAIQQAQPPGDAARRCRILLLPNCLFNFLFTPLLLFLPRLLNLYCELEPTFLVLPQLMSFRTPTATLSHHL